MSGRTTSEQRAGALGAAILTMFLSVSLCCSTAPLAMTPQHGCCRSHCVMAAAAAPLAAIAPARQEIPPPVLLLHSAAVAAIEVRVAEPAVTGGLRSWLFAAITTVRLRI